MDKDVEIDLRPWDQNMEEYDKAVRHGEAAPFRVERQKVGNAHRLRTPGKGASCRWTQVFRRVTRDADTLEIIEDVTKQDMPEDFDWHGPVLNGPRNIETEWRYADDVEDAQPATDIIGPRQPAGEGVQRLPVPIMPDTEEVRKHELTHAE